MAKKVCCLAALVLILAGTAMAARIRVGSLVQESKLVNFVRPEYPPAAKAARVQGKVELEVLIGVDGGVLEATPKSAEGLLVDAAVAAVRQWRYQQTFLNGQPVEVATTVTVNFVLDDQGQEVALIRGADMGQRLVHRVAPVYPVAAKHARIQGVVRLEAYIAKDGTIKSLRVVMGHPLMVQAALDAVRQWRYEPYIVEGQPAEVMTTVDVNFTLAAGGPEPLRLGSSQMQGKLLASPQAVYPPKAKEARIQGDVLLSVLIDKEGAPREVGVMRGHPMLAEAAVDAVKNWRWQPTLLNGEPVEVITEVHVNFTLAATI